ncbi:MAG: alanine racemase [Myxococcales bacterium]|nr:alanine racemase [Myxococcales bacterium]
MLAPLARLEAAIAPHRERLATPALIIDLDAVDHNVAAVIKRCGGDPSRWRPHVKTLKQAALLRHLFDRGVTHLKCATLDELAMVLEAADATDVDVDVLVAYPLYEAAFRSASRLADAHPRARVGFLADSPMHARSMDGWAHGGKRPLYFDVDIGMGRTGTFAPRWATHAAALAADLNHFTIAGLHGYDGHVHWEQQTEAHAGYDRLCALAHTLGDRLAPGGLADFELLTSGTHSYAHALAHPGLAAGPWRHRVSPGTIVFSDVRSAPAAADIGLRQAAFVASRVISTGKDRVTLDAGSKALTPDAGGRPGCKILDHDALLPQRASEEHLPCSVAAGVPPPALGELLWLIPDHVCTTVNLHREALWIRGGELVGHGPVDAAGHSPHPPL